jgi:hypothetical protein
MLFHGLFGAARREAASALREKVGTGFSQKATRQQRLLEQALFRSNHSLL